jgi:hypothetical protein
MSQTKTEAQHAKAIVVNGEMIKLSSLPVAPEFVDILAETAAKTALDHLRRIEAQPELIQLVESISDLGYYLKICYSHPGSLLEADRSHRFDIETVVIEAVNAIAKLGGEFHGPSGNTPPRDEVLPVSGKRTKKAK